jgi:hypothetical protein
LSREQFDQSLDGQAAVGATSSDSVGASPARWTRVRNSSGWALILLLSGCSRGPEIATVTGRVTLDDRPLEYAEITFEPAAGRASHGRADQNGRYELRYTREEMGALVGAHTVRVLSAIEVTLPDGRFELRPQLVPPQFNTESELRREVASGVENVFDFDLSSQKK